MHPQRPGPARHQRRHPAAPVAARAAGGPALLGALTATVGLGVAGWVVGIASGVVLNVLLARGLARRGRTAGHALGPADRVTLARATLACGVAALAADSLEHPTPVGTVVAPLVALSVAALVLDGVDGRLARRTGTVSALGARFDMEADAFLILVLSVYVAHGAGSWVLAIGLARYALAAAGWLLPWLRGPVPPRFWCKVVAATQGVVLTVAAADVVPPAWTVVALAVALVLLAESFGREVWLRWQSRRVQPSLVVAVGGEGRLGRQLAPGQTGGDRACDPQRPTSRQRAPA